MRDLGIRLIVDDSQKSKFASIATAAQRAQADLESRLNAPLTQYEYALNRFGGLASRAATIAVGALTVGIGGLTAAMGKLGAEFVKVNEKFGSLEITLGSALRSVTASKQVINELVNITARSPIPFQNLSNIVSSFAVIPQTNQQLLKQAQGGTLGDQQGFLRRAVRTVEAMRVFRPDQDEESAIFAIREALGGQLRSLVRRFDIPTQYLQTVSRQSTQQLKDDPMKMFAAIEKAFTSIISPEAVTKFARQPSLLAANLREQAIDIPLLKIGQTDPKTGNSPYQAALVRAQRTFDELVEFMSKNFDERFAGPLRDALTKSSSSVFDSISKMVSRVLDSFGVKGQGATVERVVEGVANALIKSAEFIADLVDKVEKNNLIDTAVKTVEGFISAAKSIVSFFVELGQITTPTFAAFAAIMTPALLNNVGTFLRTALVTLPKVLTGVGAGVWGATGIGGKAPQFADSFSILARNRIGQSNPFSTPSFLDTGSLSDKKAQEAYRNAFLRNSALSETLDPNWSERRRNSAIERARVQDMFWMTQNEKAVGGMNQAGVGGNRFVGVGMASQRQAEYDRLNPRQGMLGRFGSALGGVALGAATSLAIGAAIAAVTYGLTELYDALTATSRGIKETNQIYLNDLRDFRKELNTKDIAFNAAFTGKSLESYIGSSSQSYAPLARLRTALGQLKPGEQGGTAPLEASWLERIFSGNGIVMADTPLALGQAEREERELRLNRERGILNRNGFAPDEFSKSIDALKGEGGLSAQYADFLKKLFVEQPLKAANSLIAQIDASPGGLDGIKERLLESRKKLAEAALVTSENDIRSLLGDKAAELLKLVRTGAINSRDAIDVTGTLEQLSGVSNIRTRALRVNEVTQNTFVAQTNDQINAAYVQNFSGRDQITKVKNLVKVADEARSSFDNIFEDLGDSVDSFSEIKQRILGNKEKFNLTNEKAAELISTLEKIDPLAVYDTLRDQLTASTQLLGANGQVFITTMQSFVLGIEKFATSFGKLTPTEFADQVDQLNQLLSAGGIKSSLSLSAPLRPFEGTATEVAGSQVKVYEQLSSDLIKRMQDPALFGEDNEKIVKFIEQLVTVTLPGLIDVSRQELANSRFNALGGSLRGNTGFNPALLRDNPDLARSLEAAGLSGDANSRARAELFPVSTTGGTAEELDRRQKILNLQYATTKDDKVRLQIEGEINDLLAERARLAIQSDPNSFFDGMVEGLRTAQEQLQNFAKMGYEIGQTIKSAFGDAFANIVTGTESVSQAFRNMAVNILKSMAQIFAQQAAAQLLNYVIGGFFAAGANTSAGMSAAGAPSGLAVRSGLATGGSVMGGSGMRDDVPALLTGGEYVINRRAAQSIGYHNLDRMNHSGGMLMFARGGSVPSNGSAAAGAWGGGSYHNTTIDIKIDSSGKPQTDVRSSALNAKAMAEAIDALIEQKFQDKMLPGAQFNPVNPMR